MTLGPSKYLPQKLKAANRIHHLFQPTPEERAHLPASAGEEEPNFHEHQGANPDGFHKNQPSPALRNFSLP